MAKSATKEKTEGPPVPTIPERPRNRHLRQTRAVRRAAIALIIAFVGVGLTGLLGSRTQGVTASGGGYTLSVIYPKVTRPGLPVRWVYTVRHSGGWGDQVQISTSFRYFDLFDVTGIHPDASSQTATPLDVVFSFDPPPGDTFAVEFDAATEPGLHEAPLATASVLVEGSPVVQVHFRTVVMP